MTVVTLENLGSIGVIRDISPYKTPPEAWTDSLNMRFNNEGASRMKGTERVLTEATHPGDWIKFFPSRDSPNWVYHATDADKLYAINGGSQADISKAGGTYNSIGAERWQGNVFNGYGVLNNTVDPPQQWTKFDTGIPLVDLPNWPVGYKAKVIRPFSAFLVAMGLNDGAIEYPYRIRWSSAAAPGEIPFWDITDPARESGEFDLYEGTGEPIDALRLGDSLIVYEENTVYSMRYIGGVNVFAFPQLFPEGGILWRDCFATIPNGHLVASLTDIYVHSGQRGSYQSILQDRTRKWLFSLIDSDNYRNSFVVKNRPEKEVWFCFPESGETSATLAYVWNWESHTGSFREVGNANFGDAAPTIEGTMDDTWDGGPDESWDAGADIPWGGAVLSRGSDLPVFSAAGVFEQADRGVTFQGNSFTSRLERTGLTIAGTDKQGRPVARPDLIKLCNGIFPNILAEDGTNIKISIGSQEQPNKAVTWQERNFVCGVDTFLDYEVSSKYLCVRFECEEDRDWNLISYGLDLEIIGKY